MTTDANLLRRYHANLSAAEDEPKLWKIDREFRTRHKLNPDSNSIETIWSAHLCRVRGRDAACDEALAKAIREIGS